MAPTTRPITSNCLQCLCKKPIQPSFSLRPRNRTFGHYATTSASPVPSTRSSTPRIPRTQCLKSSSIVYTPPIRAFSYNTPLRNEASTNAPPEEPPARVEPEGLVHLRHRRLIAVSGKDTAKYLHGIVSATVKPGGMWTSGQLVYTAFLNSKGRLREDAILYPWDSTTEQVGTGEEEEGRFGVLIEVDEGRVDDLLLHLKKHKLRSKVKWRVLDPHHIQIWHLWNNTATPSSSTLSTTLPAQTRAFTDPRFQIHASAPDESASPPRNIRILHADSTPLPSLLPTPQRTTQAYTLQRYIHALPEGPTELPPASALPMEANMDILPAIDFHKGCYVGQELTIRTRHTGVIRKRILPVYLSPLPTPEAETNGEVEAGKEITFPWADLAAGYAPTTVPQVPPGADIKAPRGGRAAGRMLGAVGNVGLALCRLEKMTEVQVGEEAGNIKPGSGLVVAWEEEGGEMRRVGVRAVVPPVVRRVYPE